MLLNTGHGSFIPLARVAWVAPLVGSAMKTLKHAKQEAGLLIDLTYGHAAASIIGIDTGHLILSAISAEALKRRIEKRNEEETP